MSQTPRNDVQDWLDRSDYDLKTAEAMLQTGRYLYVFFCCQQAVEKRYKARILSRTGQMPPRIHDLVRLAEIAQVELSPDQERLSRDLNRLYIQSRYPLELGELGKEAVRELAEQVLRDVKGYSKWLDRLTN